MGENVLEGLVVYWGALQVYWAEHQGMTDILRILGNRMDRKSDSARDSLEKEADNTAKSSG